ncbi:MAG: UDP-N-acetylmuramate dehydrogenase [Coxiellaceae bacterium]|nr:UDP-N-acetylmuramate dehydrogenase [Coxiellaceae bacterium]
MIIQENSSLKSFNTFGIAVTARYFAKAHSVEALQTLLTHYQSPLILGGGSNILFTKNVAGLVIHNCISGIEKVAETDDHVFLKIGAGENWHQLVLYCIKNNYAGIENLSLIPGTVGAAPIQNIGAYGVELKDVLECVAGLEISPTALLSTPFFIRGDDCEFGYRDSIFKRALKNKVVITQVTLRLNKKPVFHLEYGAIRDKIQDKPLSIKTISDAVIAIRQEKLPDPKLIGNAGSFFKNPIISAALFSSLQTDYPNIPFFQEANGDVKIPAGWLIEQCGFKGKRFGDIGVHEHQALVLINYGGGTGLAIKELSKTIQETVFRRFKILLNTEVNII